MNTEYFFLIKDTNINPENIKIPELDDKEFNIIQEYIEFTRHIQEIDQLFHIFREDYAKRVFSKSYINVDSNLFPHLYNTYKELLPFNEHCQILNYKGINFHKYTPSIPRTLKIIFQTQPSFFTYYHDLVSDYINEENIELIVKNDSDDLVDLIKEIGFDFINIDSYRLSRLTLPNLSSLIECSIWCNLFKDDVIEYDAKQQEILCDNLNYFAAISIQAASTVEECEGLLDCIDEISKHIPYWNSQNYKSEIIDKLSIIDATQEVKYEDYEFREIDRRNYYHNNDYYDMFSSLLVK